MNPEAQRVRDLFLATIKLPRDQWETFLTEACAGDAKLRRQVSDLLHEHLQADSFLDRPAVPPLRTTETVGASEVAAAAPESAGTIIGPYKLLERIGEGGMGIVWMAEQREPVQRKVALKIIKAGMDTREVVARFEAERQALALMDHPNIARVFDGGTTAGGRPYFVMELVKGVPITRYCDEHRLKPRERLELFLPICQAIQHAHQKGIIHRDIKPANVLVAPYDGRPVPKIIDFGVAKAIGQRLTEHTLFTGFGAVVGTLEYMSPEQAELNNQDIDTRSDIYSLGVLLYELLTGTTPLSRERLKRSAFLDMLRAIREEEPPRPSTRLSDSKDSLPSLSAQRQMEPAKLTRLVRGELDWIVMKALEKDRSRRYETANSLAMDVQNYLADEQVLACPPTVGYRLRKFARRNRRPMLAAGFVALALVAGIIGTTWGLLRSERARADAVAAQLAEVSRAEGERRAREAETIERLRAEGNVTLAMSVLDEIFLKEARQQQTLQMQDEAKGAARSPEREKHDREFLEKGLRFFEQLAQANATDWKARRARAKAYANVGLLHLELKNYAESEKAYRQAAQRMDELAAERPDDFENAYDLAQAYNWGYRAYWDSGRLKPAEEMTRKALFLFDKLTADFPDRRSQFLGSICACQRNLALVLQKAGKPQEAAEAFQQALTLWAELVQINAELSAINPDAPELRDALARTHYEMAEVYQASGQLDDAQKAYHRALALWEKVATDRPERREYQSHAAYTRSQIGHLDWSLAGMLKGAGKIKEAEEACRRALRHFEKLAADHPAQAFYRQEHAYSYWHLAWLAKETGQVQEAQEAYRQALSIHEKLVADYPDNALYRSRLLADLGEVTESLLQQGKHAEAARIAERIADHRPKDSDGYARSALALLRCTALTYMDNTLSEADRAAVARKYADRARALLQQAAKQGGDTPIAQTLREALHLPRDDPQAHFLVGNALHHYGQYAGAEAEFREALRLRPDFPMARANLARARWHLGKKAEVEAEYREAMRLRPDDPEVYFTLGFILGWGEGKHAAAARFYAEAFAAHSNLADDTRFPNRYNAACAAALAGCGRGADAASLNETERARLRQQALAWLRAELTASRQLLEKQPEQASAKVQRTMQRWQWDGDFGGMRGDALAKLPEAERQGWQQLWADVEQTLKNADRKDTKGAPNKSPE